VCWVLDGLLRCACVCEISARACNESVRWRVCSSVCLCSCACVRACPCVYARLFERTEIVIPSVCAASVCVLRPCVRLGAVWAVVARRGPAVIIARPAAPGTRVVAVRCDRPGSRAFAAGIHWTSRTLKAGWAARFGHTSVIDAAEAIYVIGGNGASTGYSNFNDVFVSTDGGV
jgi:hypothetical protein